MFTQEDMMEVVQKYRGDAVVIPEERATRAWPDISTYKKRDVTADVMGKGSSLALGLAMSQPDTKVIVFDGDGSLEMNLGTLVTVGEQQPRNLYHFVLENGMYATTGGQPILCKDRISFTGLARSAGYAAAYDFDDLEEFAQQAEDVLNQPGPVMICVKTVPNPRSREDRMSLKGWGMPPVPQMIADLKKDLASA